MACSCEQEVPELKIAFGSFFSSQGSLVAVFQRPDIPLDFPVAYFAFCLHVYCLFSHLFKSCVLRTKGRGEL